MMEIMLHLRDEDKIAILQVHFYIINYVYTFQRII